ncbi:conserved Plasmodium protein, unknown function [Plasmodium sp. gorilla clade G2]|uniref:conserved Plasmodium protein, unknown function n=1 Tax=Plasmodium sp. gorilla clade G2 TaxID=880535 RepID=UPI000D20C609|nr:conserved Plasmodium protein, unknown function [Plasmodium sp. gorilla clade G2]SOV10915.1 conserved Plasmodium protein, unknown function [Plasmodium sp. gorilla clade G2]
MNSNNNMLNNNSDNTPTGSINNDIPERDQEWVDSPETRNILNYSVNKTFINIPYENYYLGLNELYTIDTEDVFDKYPCELPKIENLCTMFRKKDNTAQNEDKGNNNNVDLHENRICNVQENDRFTHNNTKDVNLRYPTHNFEYLNSTSSFGTQFHNKGKCKPCKYEWTRGCHMGLFCRFCHDQSHVPAGTKRVIPSPQDLAISRVKPENIFISTILNENKKNRKYKKNENKGKRKGMKNKIDDKKEEEKMGNQKKEHRTNNQKKEHKTNNQRKEHKTNNQTKEHRTNNQTKEHKTNNQTKEHRTNNQTKEHKTNNQTKEYRTNNQTKEHRTNNYSRENKINHQKNKKSQKMNDTENKRNPQNIGIFQRRRNQRRKRNYNGYSKLNTWNNEYNYLPYKDYFFNYYYNTFISNVFENEEKNELYKIFGIIVERDKTSEECELLNNFDSDLFVNLMNIHQSNMKPMLRY